MKYLLFVSLIFSFGAASRVGDNLATPSNGCFKSSVPRFSSVLYSASIDIVGHHISGLLFLKTMPDSSQRAVFSNETGITFFDFEWKKNGEFKTYQVIKKLRRRVVINTLRKDFELIVVPNPLTRSIQEDSTARYLVFRKKERVIFKTDQNCQSIASVDVMGRRSKLVEVKLFPSGKNIPDSVTIVHHNFRMEIRLKKLER